MPAQGMLWLALGTVYIVWGSTYLAIRIVLETMPPFLSAGSRFVAAGLLMGLLLRWRRGRGSLRVRASELGACAIVGGLLLLGGNGLVVVAEQHIDSGLAALVVAAVPLWVVLLRLANRDRPRAATVAAVLVGFGGIAVLLSPGSGGSTRMYGVLTVLCASFSWSVGSYFSAHLPLPTDPFVTTVYEMFTGGALMLLVALARGEFWSFSPADMSGRSWLALAYLTIAGSLVAFTAYVWLLSRAPISFVATYAYVNPAVAVLLGALVLNEPVTWPIIVGGAIVVVSVAVVVSVEHRPQGAPPDPGAPVAEALEARARP
jgi:drug/metabolite transporter (DMT)-like permease